MSALSLLACPFGSQIESSEQRDESRHTKESVVVVNLASRPPQFLGSASSAPEGLGSQDGANLVRD